MTKGFSKRAKEIISQIQYVTIASAGEDGLPWNAPVFSAYDEDYNSTVPSGTGEGVYVRAKAHEVTQPDEVKRVYELLKARHAPAHFWEWEAIQEEGPIHLYKAVPQKAWMNDDGNKNGHYIDIRTEIQL